MERRHDLNVVRPPGTGPCGPPDPPVPLTHRCRPGDCCCGSGQATRDHRCDRRLVGSRGAAEDGGGADDTGAELVPDAVDGRLGHEAVFAGSVEAELLDGLAGADEVLGLELEGPSLAYTGATSLSSQERKSAVAEAIKAGEESLLLQGVSVDLSNMVPSGSGSAFFPVDGSTRIQNFLNQVYFSLEGNVKPFTYGVDWILVDLTGTEEREFRDMGSLWAGREADRISDTRLLREVGIEAGARLTAKRLAD